MPEIAVGGGEYANVEPDGLAAADTFDLAFLDDTQQLGLQADLHFGNFVEQQRAVLGLFELTRVGGASPGKSPFFMAEQHGFEHVLRNRCAVDRNKRFVLARRMFVQITCDNLLAATAFTADHHGCLAARDSPCELQQLDRAGIFRHGLTVCHVPSQVAT